MCNIWNKTVNFQKQQVPHETSEAHRYNKVVHAHASKEVCKWWLLLEESR